MLDWPPCQPPQSYDLLVLQQSLSLVSSHASSHSHCSQCSSIVQGCGGTHHSHSSGGLGGDELSHGHDHFQVLGLAAPCLQQLYGQFTIIEEMLFHTFFHLGSFHVELY